MPVITTGINFTDNPATEQSLWPLIKPSLNLDFKSESLGPLNWSKTETNRTSTYLNSSGFVKKAMLGSPRFTHNPTTLRPEGLLLEAQATNTFQYSESTSLYGSDFFITIAADDYQSPDGITKADRWKESDTASRAQHWKEHSISVTTGQIHTISMFVRPDGDRNVFGLHFFPDNSAFGSGICWFDCTGDGSVLYNDLPGFDQCVAGMPTIVKYPRGWYRISASNKATATATGYFSYRYTKQGNINSSNGSIGNYTGDTSRGPWIWGIQNELGSISSYMPTEGGTSTRLSDSGPSNEGLYMSGTAVEDFYSQGKGTWFIVSTGPTNLYTNGTNHHLITLSNAAKDDASAYQVRYNGVARLASWGSFSSIVSEWNFHEPAAFAYVPYRRYVAALALDDVAETTKFWCYDPLDTGVTLRYYEDNDSTKRTDIASLRVGSYTNGSQPYLGTIESIRYYPERLTDAQIEHMIKRI